MILFWFIVSCSVLTIVIMMVIFWSSALSSLLSILISLFLPSSLLKYKKNQHEGSEFYAKNNQLMAINVANFHDRIIELEQDFAENSINESHFNSQKIELQRQLIQAETVESLNNSFSATTKIIFSISVILLTVLAYCLIESRDTTHQHWTNQQKYGQVADEILTGKIDIPPDWSIDTASTRHALLTAMQSNLHQHTNSSDLKTQQTNSQRWLRMSTLLLTMKKTDSALIAMERAVRLERDYTSSNYAKLATSYAKTSYFAHNEAMPAKAEKMLNTLITHQPEHKGAVILLVMNATRKGDHQQALELVSDLRRNIERGNDSAEKDKALANLNILISSIKNNQMLMTE